MSIEVVGLVKKYGKQYAVNDISFDIPKGQVVGFLGPNGAGKSTTMKILTTFLTPNAGRALVCGMDVQEEALKVRAKIGYLPEQNPLYPDMYIQEFLHFIARTNGLGKASKKRVEEMISITGLAKEKSKKIGALSKGYKQRVGLAQALMHNPEVLILDEPTSGLDPNQIIEIRNLIKTIGEERTILLSTHIMQEVEAMCNRVVIINNGRLVADDHTDKIRQSSGAFKRVLVQFKNSLDIQKLKNIEGFREVIQEPDNRFGITADADVKVQEILFKFAVDTQNIILEQNEKVHSLEDVFRNLTKDA
jgi:ABC-2 type transport system ATP-binding protein